MIWFYGISTIVGYLIPNPISLSLYIYIYIKFGLVRFYRISTIVDYLMSNTFYIDISNIYDLVWVLWHINHCRLLNPKYCLYIY